MLAGKELPTFKFELEKSEGKVIGGSYGKEATVKQLPISKGIAGVSMKLEPGAMRELHWHATAAEWAFVIEGRVRTTVIDPQGRSETNDFEPGDIWYFPRGHGHMLECLGNKPAHFILIFDNGYFSEFGTFSITDWIGHTPKHLLAKNFGLPESAFDGFPKDEVYFARGPVPPETTHAQPPGAAHVAARDAQVPDAGPGAPFHPQGRPRMAGRRRPFPHLEDRHRRHSRPRARRLARAPLAPDVRRVAICDRGQISVTLFGSHGRYRIETLNKGDVGYIPQGYGHSIENVGSQALPRPDRFQYGPLRSDRPFAVDRRQSDRRARHELRQASFFIRKVPTQ